MRFRNIRAVWTAPVCALFLAFGAPNAWGQKPMVYTAQGTGNPNDRIRFEIYPKKGAKVLEVQGTLQDSLGTRDFSGSYFPSSKSIRVGGGAELEGTWDDKLHGFVILYRGDTFYTGLRKPPAATPTAGTPSPAGAGFDGVWLGSAGDGRYQVELTISGKGGGLSASQKVLEKGKVVGTSTLSIVEYTGTTFKFTEEISPPPGSGWATSNAGNASLNGDSLVMTYTKYATSTTLHRKK